LKRGQETMPLEPKDLERGTELFLRRLEEIVDAEPEVSDIHDAFEFYCARRYSLGNSGSNDRVGGKDDLGIDFYSQHEHSFHVGQCKIPERDYLEAHPEKHKIFGTQAVGDVRDALRYLTGDSDLKPNERVRQLYAHIENDRNAEDFSLKLYVVVFGRLNQRGIEAFNELKGQYESSRITVVLQQIEDLVDEFLVGAEHTSDEIKFDLRTNTKEILRANNYCYFLANAADLYEAFTRFGWRLFDLNLRYEVRNSSINGEIVGSLTHQRSRRDFHHYNNGLIIVAKSYKLNDQEGRVRIVGGQIVNGLQTVKSIFNAVVSKEVSLEEIEADCVVQIKLIKAPDAEFVSRVVRSTNNQNPMAARNLRSNNREQKILRTGFKMIDPKWFYQLKEGEWDSLTGESAHFFEQIVGYKAFAFKPEPARKYGRVIDNQDAAKAWLAFIGFADLSGDRVTHYFADDKVYEQAFASRPSIQYWRDFAKSLDWDKQRVSGLERQQGLPVQYLLAYFLWRFVSGFIPSPQKYREQALDEGVSAGKISKASGSFTTPMKDQDEYLAGNQNYQTWRVMANMKELLVEAAAQVLARKYGPLDQDVCEKLLNLFEAAIFVKSGDIREIASSSAIAPDLNKEQVFGRIFQMLHFVSQQFWEGKKDQLLSTSRLRTVLVNRSAAEAFKTMLWEVDRRAGLDKAWKPGGVTFLDSLPPLP
jgi:hypothetical protein